MVVIALLGASRTCNCIARIPYMHRVDNLTLKSYSISHTTCWTSNTFSHAHTLDRMDLNHICTISGFILLNTHLIYLRIQKGV